VSFGHPLGNFTVNRCLRLTVGAGRAEVRYVIDMAEIPTLQETQSAPGGAPSSEWLSEYAKRMSAQCARNVRLVIDGVETPMQAARQNALLRPGAGGLSTLRIEMDFVADFAESGAVRRLRIEDANDPERIGWREIVVAPQSGVAVFNSSALGGGLSDELKSYPEDRLAAPLDERTAEMSFIRGSPPPGCQPLLLRNGAPAVAPPAADPFVNLVTVSSLTPSVALLGILVAFALGAVHSLSPGHGKTVVGAYLVGSRGTPRHAAFLGLTVTMTHTAGVFALGVVTLVASRYILPERLFPFLSLISGVIVVAIGMNLCASRWRFARAGARRHHAHGDHVHAHDSHGHSHAPHDHSHVHEDGRAAYAHTHDGHTHSHLPPGADGSPVSWRSLLALGVSGGLLPCPSALVVLLSAISLNRTGYGILLVIAFSLGLAMTLTVIGLLFLYTGRFIGERLAASNANSRIRKLGGHAVRYAPVAGALVITLVGMAMCGQVLVREISPPAPVVAPQTPQSPAPVETPSSAALRPESGAPDSDEPSLAQLGFVGLLGLGLVFGLKHATEADHIVAVSSIVSEQRSVVRSALVGGLWGIGHTLSIVFVGVITLSLRIAIPEAVARWLEFGVSIMIIGLGTNGILGALSRRRHKAHGHVHAHGNATHAHFHFHDDVDAHHPKSSSPGHFHQLRRLGIKPLLVGAAHGLAGSAALTLLVLTQISSVWIGLAYLAIFGVGSVGGMLAMSGIIGIPFAFGAAGRDGIHFGLRLAAGCLSVAFGFWYAYVQRDLFMQVFLASTMN
jgi:ABC-type nickel/cobalt efflux system permease component RcnA